MFSSVVLHVPHSGTHIPSIEKEKILISGNELRKELFYSTDWFTDELYPVREHDSVVNTISRYLVDMERFVDDDLEPMAKRGQGVVYTHTSNGDELRKLDPEYRTYLIRKYYDSHHNLFTNLVERSLSKFNKCLVVDCHSYDASRMTCIRQEDKPEICIGADDYHTSRELVDKAVSYAKEAGFTVGVNVPFAGTIVPQKFYQKDKRIQSIMIEIDRGLYMEPEPIVLNITPEYAAYCVQKKKNYTQIAGFLEAFVAELERFVNNA